MTKHNWVPAHVVEIVTPKKYVLNGLWFGPKKPKTAIIFLHGLTASAFSMRHLVHELVDPSTSVLTFNNRGFEKITEIKKGRGESAKWVSAGAAHEVFTECVDDIQGAVNTAKRSDAKNIFVIGHSTGAQKAVYWAFKNGRGVHGLILLGPLSDYASVMRDGKRGKLRVAQALSRKLVRAERGHELLPRKMTGWLPLDAQRFLSLNTPDSVEQSIFSYFDPKKKPSMLKSVRLPILSIFAGRDEHADRPAQQIATWLEKHIRNGNVVIIPRVKHSFRGGEKAVAREIRRFMER